MEGAEVDRFAVLGATSWGIALASLLAENGRSVRVLVRGEAERAEVDARRGIARLSGLRLPPAVAIEVQPGAPREGEGLVIAVPVQRLREALQPMAGWRGASVLSAAKGLEMGSGLRPSQVLATSGWDPLLVAALSGPNLSHEVAAGLPAAAVVAGPGDELVGGWQRALSGGNFRVYRSADIVGVELAGAMKNVIAIAAGAAWGLGFGANTVASVVTRGLAEMTRLGLAAGAAMPTYLGLAGVGDLTATCFSPLSRNRRMGELLAGGLAPGEALKAVGETVEGVATAPVVLDLARAYEIEVPITEQVAAVVRGEMGVRAAMAGLLARGLTAEAPGGW